MWPTDHGLSSRLHGPWQLWPRNHGITLEAGQWCHVPWAIEASSTTQFEGSGAPASSACLTASCSALLFSAHGLCWAVGSLVRENALWQCAIPPVHVVWPHPACNWRARCLSCTTGNPALGIPAANTFAEFVAAVEKGNVYANVHTVAVSLRAGDEAAWEGGGKKGPSCAEATTPWVGDLKLR